MNFMKILLKMKNCFKCNFIFSKSGFSDTLSRVRWAIYSKSKNSPVTAMA